MRGLRAGGLAIVISSKIPDLVGTCVKLIRLLSPGRVKLEGITYVFKDDEGPAWLCDLPDGMIILKPRQLMPIDGRDFTEHEREKEKVL